MPAADIGEAVGGGRLAAGYTSPAYLAAREPALAIFGGTPFAPSAADHYAWLREGGGLELLDALYARQNLKGIPCVIAGPEGFGWFRQPLLGADDLDGLRMRIVGLGARVVQRLGVDAVSLPSADIWPELERGEIDATEFAMPYIDIELGFDLVAPHYYYPGFLQPFSQYDLIIDRARWEGLSAADRQAIEAACHDNVLYGLEQDGPMAEEALRRIRQKGVNVQAVPPAIVASAKRAWAEVAAELSAADADFARIYDAYRRFLATRPGGDPLG